MVPWNFYLDRFWYYQASVLWIICVIKTKPSTKEIRKKTKFGLSIFDTQKWRWLSEQQDREALGNFPDIKRDPRREHGSKLSGLFHLSTRLPFSFRVQPGAFATEQHSLRFSWNLWIGPALISISRVPSCKTFMLPASQTEQFCLNIYKLPSTPGRNPLPPPAALPQFFGGVFS